jgi:nitrate reductase NapE
MAAAICMLAPRIRLEVRDMHQPTTTRPDDDLDPTPARRRELVVFLFLAVVLAPILAVMVVGGYGFLVWISQMIFGPPTG